MEINDIIKKLERVRSQIGSLAKNTNTAIELWHFDNYWEIKIYESTAYDADCCYYKDFDSLDEVENHLAGMYVGTNLMLCKEI